MNPTAREALAACLQHRVPLCTQRLLHIGPEPGHLCAVVRARCGAETVAADVFPELAERDFDAIVFSSMPEPQQLAQAGQCLGPDGCVVLVTIAAPPPVIPGLQHYTTWPLDWPNCELDDVYAPALGEAHVLLYRHPAYDVVAHAQRLAAARRFDHAYEILCGTPPQARADAAFDVRVQQLKMVCLLGLNKLGAYPALQCLAAGQLLFSRIQRRLPNVPENLLLLARFWDVAAEAPMAARLRTLAEELSTASPQPVRPCEASPTKECVLGDVYAPTNFELQSKPRVLFVMGDERLNYGLDVLYHGLKRVLGEEHVTEYPFKPTLHGARSEAFAHYPAHFQHVGAPLSAEALLQQLNEGHYDLIVWGDVEMHIPQPVAQALAGARGKARLVFLDMRDDCADHAAETAAWLDLAEAPLYFKRELLTHARYAAPTSPLPFAYADELVSDDIDNPRAGVFWAGQRGWCLRDVFLPALEQRGIDTGRVYNQPAYRAALRGAAACLNLAGAGFDTVRYWEGPAQGGLLLSENLPIVIPHNFADMHDALFFSTRAELDTRLDYLAAHPSAVEEMRRCGWQKLCEHHIASARARQFLAQALVPTH